MSVTIPHKETVLAELDGIDEEVAEIRASNTLVKKEGGWIGYNTDASGFMKALQEFLGVEKLKRRLLLVLPTVLCLACALAADGLNMYLGLGQMYTALAAAIAALLHLATVLPKNKTVIAG